MMIVLGQMKNVTQLIRYVGFHAMVSIALKMKSVILPRNCVSQVRRTNFDNNNKWAFNI